MTKTIQPVRTAVFPVAGLGTRFLPATKSVPKEMLTVVDKPVIQHVVDEARQAGIEHFVFVTGRTKELIIKGGENIAPREIDEALYKHAAVQDAAAVGIPDDEYGQEILCCCVLKPDCDCTEEELREFCRDELGEFKTPKVIKVMSERP